LAAAAPLAALALLVTGVTVGRVEFGILGPLVAWTNGRELPLGAPKQRAVLALLLLRRNELVPTATVVDLLWGERPPATAVKAVQVYVSQLRKALGDDAVETRPLGYALRVEPGTLDAATFEELLARGRGLLDEGDAAEASAVLRRALGLWRGPALSDFRYDAFARDETGRLEELRFVALEHRLEADLALGRHAEAVPELEALVREHPLRESLRGLLMLALYRAGRQADALAAYQEARTTLVEELGLDPGETLQRLEQAILRHDASLDLAVASAREPAPETPSASPAATREQRKVVTVLVARVTGAAELGERPDPEALNTLLRTAFERMRAVVEAHGGAPESLIGDGLMAVFGLPTVHEDDALRALRAAAAIRDAFAELGLEGRIGVESGEVLAGGDPGRSVIGDAVTTAARLEQAAAEGEVLLGERAMRLARGAATATPLESHVTTGRRPLAAWRLDSVSAESAPRQLDSELVGREVELRALDEAWARVGRERRCELVTVLGPAGIGKSRLVAEFAKRAAAPVVSGRCVSYGTEITYWPVVDILAQLGPQLGEIDEPVRAPLQALVEDSAAASVDELAWAFRKLVEAAARERPLVVVFDDVHWAQDVLLDLLEHVAVVSSGAPILLLCMSREELLEKRPGWGGVLRLEPLTDAEAERLVRARLGDSTPSPEVSRRIVESSRGNPLFVEELIAMLQGSPGEEIATPPTIQAILAARLDQLEPAEREVLEAGAVEGEVFHRGAVGVLRPDERRLTAVLTSLVRKGVVRVDRPEFEGEDAFRFRHLLLRDVTYDAIPKLTRSELHDRYAGWLEEHLVGADAFLGYHLERAYRYRVEVLAVGAESDALARRACDRLERAATTALGRSDLPAAIGLLERAASLPPVAESRRALLLVDLAATLADAGELAEAERVLDDVGTAAPGADGDGIGERLLVERQFLELHRAAPGTARHSSAIVERVLPTFERAADEQGLCRALRLQAYSDWTLGRLSNADDAWERAAEHARRAGREHERADILTWLASSTWFGATPVDAGIARCEEIQREVHGHPTSEAEILRVLGGLHAFAGRLDLARSLFAASNAAFADLGLELHHMLSHPEALVEMLVGDFAAAEARLRRGYDAYEAMGENGLRSTTAALLARAVLAQGRLEEAERFSMVSEELAEPDDLATHILWRGVAAKLHAARGRLEDADRLAREALSLTEQTDFVVYRADAFADLASVLETGGRDAEARAALADAARLYEQKGNTIGAAAVRARLES
jgi:DNA-binding SARP family transcriptional activator